MPAMFGIYTGQAAGVATSALWTVTSLLFTAAGQRISPVIVNGTRLVCASMLLAVTHRLTSGAWLPHALPGQVAFLAVSGLIGLSLGDLALFISFVDIGPRLAMLVMTTAPLFAALFGWLVLGETLHGVAAVGMVLTVGGVGWVVLERPSAKSAFHSPHKVRGLTLALIASACQAGGLLLSKQGMGHGWLPDDQHLDPLAATLVRMVFAVVGMIPILVFYARWDAGRRAVGSGPKRIGSPGVGLLFSCLGAVTGPFLGVWMSLVASDRAPLAVAQTCCSLSPVLLLPLAAIIYKEHVTARAVIGAIVAVAGVGLLFVDG